MPKNNPAKEEGLSDFDKALIAVIFKAFQDDQITDEEAISNIIKFLLRKKSMSSKAWSDLVELFEKLGNINHEDAQKVVSFLRKAYEEKKYKN